jgi:hypothetical protein
LSPRRSLVKFVRKLGVAPVLVSVLALVLVASAPAGDEVTLTGSLVCAKCSLKKADAKVCQNVLIVTGDKAGEYYLAKTAAADKYGDVCTGKKSVKVTGALSDKDGKKWIAASKIEDLAG